MRMLLVLPGWLMIASALAAGPGLPEHFDPDPAIPTPSEYFDFEPGQWHPRHDQIVAYLQALAGASDRLELAVHGTTHGQRPLVYLTFASPERLADIEALADARRQASRRGEGPPVVWLGYAVHGNEASAATAAVLTAWYLAADRSLVTAQWLDEMVIVMEPVLNPDGLDRFAHWVNMHRGRHPSADPADREHNEPWPNGRTNYYWFDLNRDWLPLVHPESRTRMQQYYRWLPHVLTDVHEMGSETTYFFQPGVPERNNPLTPERNYELTRVIAEYHARALDEVGEPYFTRELFDDYYVGKGSTYPDLTGGIGILFEQASVRGHVQDTRYGRRHFADAVANQVRTSLSTLTASHALADQLIAYQAEFFSTSRQQAARYATAGWVIGDGGDPVRAVELISLLMAHDIQVRPLTEPTSVSGQDYPVGSAWLVAADQDQFRLARSLLEPVTELPMDTFYDVSAWPLAMASGLPMESVRRLPAAGAALTEPPTPPVVEVPQQAVAWLVPWDQYRAPVLLADLLAKGYRVQVATQPLTIDTDQGSRSLVRGSLILHQGLQPEGLEPLQEVLAATAPKLGVGVHAANTGLASDGIDLGSPSAPVLEAPRPALVTGRGLNANHAGYIWHWFDTRLNQPLVQLEWSRLARHAALADYSHLILPDGAWQTMPDWVAERIEEFVRGGGTLIALRSAASWVEDLSLDWSFVEDNHAEREDAPQRRDHADFRADFARQLIGGAALHIDLDISHPLGFGYREREQVVFRQGRQKLRGLNNPYVIAAAYEQAPLAAGYLSEDNRDRLAGSSALDASRHGQGWVVRIADDPLFRGYWLGSERLFANALFFSTLIGWTELPR